MCKHTDFRGAYDDELMPARRYDVDLTAIYCMINDNKFMPIRRYDVELTSIYCKINAVSPMVA